MKTSRNLETKEGTERIVVPENMAFLQALLRANEGELLFGAPRRELRNVMWENQPESLALRTNFRISQIDRLAKA